MSPVPVVRPDGGTAGAPVAQDDPALVVDPTQHPAWPDWIARLRASVGDRSGPRRAAATGEVVAAVLRSLAARDGWDPRGHELRLGRETALPDPVDGPTIPAALLGPDLLGAVHEALLDPRDRRAAGAHYTPAPLASALLRWALAGWDAGPSVVPRVLDLAVGGGAFLLAAARLQRAAGRPVEDVLAGLHGVDVDPGALAVAEAALVAWGRSEGWDGRGPGPTLEVADGTDPDPFGPDGPQPGQVDLVVGNPPFRGQLGRATARDRVAAARLRRRWGPELAGYVDDAAVFLRIACAWPRPGGRVVLVQPESVLGARDAGAVRRAVADRADLVGLWVAGEPAFAAAVDVCAPVLDVRPAGATPAADQVARADGVAVRPGPADTRPVGASWAPLLARRRGVPAVDLDRGTGTLDDLVTTTAGFRQHFYALAPHLGEAPSEGGGPSVPVLTTGLVDPLTLDWGERPARIAGARWTRPAVDLVAVGAEAPDVAAWVRARLRPKVVVAPQGRVVEAAVDATGRFVPGVPLVAVEPRPVRGAGGPSEDPGLVLWLVVAALSAPPVSAWALHVTAGTGRHRDALRLTAGQVRQVPLPGDREAWTRAARSLRAGAPLDRVGPDLAAAYGLERDDPVVAWWRSRLPRRPPARP